VIEGTSEQPALPADPRESLRPAVPRSGGGAARTMTTWTVGPRPEGMPLRDMTAALSGSMNYVLDRVIGEGGVGEVWTALQVSLNRVVAVKRLRRDRSYGDLDPDSDQRRFQDQRFHDEAMITAQLEHPNIVPVYDFGQDADGMPVLAMKRVRGEPWDAILRRDFAAMPPEEFLAKHLPVLVDMMQAVAFAHSRGVVHRDLKPSQVMVGEFGEVSVIDWGLAIVTDEGEVGDHLSPRIDPTLPTPSTATNPSGTPALMAPEQTENDARRVSTRTDIYLLGGTLYFLLTGTYPHDASTSSVSMRLAARGDVPPPSERAPGRWIPDDLAALATRALRLDPEERPASVRVLIGGVQDWMTGASDRRVSEKLTESVGARLGSLEKRGLRIDAASRSIERTAGPLAVDDVYTILTECRAVLDRAHGLWAGNPALAAMRDLAQTCWAHAALESGDLRLAQHVLAEIRSPDLREPLARRLAVADRRVARQARTRRVAVGLVAALAVALLAGALKYSVDQRAAAANVARERDAADFARRVAVSEAERASESLDRAEREQYFATISFVESCVREGRLERARELLLSRTPAHLRSWEWGHLLARCSAETMLLYDTEASTDALHAEWSPDGSRIYTGDRAGRVAAWDAATGRLLDVARLHGNGVWSIAVSPDGSTLLTGSFDSTGAIVDARTLEVRHRLEGHGAILRGGTFSPDGTRAVTTSRDRTMRFWDVATGAPIATVSDFASGTYEAHFSPDGAKLLVAAGKVAELRDPADGALLARTAEHPESILSVAFSPDGTRFATACTDRKIRVFETGGMAQAMEIDNVTSWLQSIAWMPDGDAIAAGDNEGFVRLWDARTGERLASFATRPHVFKIRCSPDGRRFATASSRAVQIWDADRRFVDTGIVRAKPDAAAPPPPPEARACVYGAPLEGDSAWRGYDANFRPSTQPGGRATFARDGASFAFDSYYAAIAPDGALRVEIDPRDLKAVVVDGKTGAVVKPLSVDKVFHAEWSPAGDRFLTGFVNGDFMLWDAKTLATIGTVGESKPLEKGTSPRILGGFRFSPDGSRILAVRYTGTAEIFDARTRERLLSLGPEDGPLYVAAWSPDGRYVAAAGLNARVRVWEAATGLHVSTLRGHSDIVMTVAFHPTADRILTASHDDEAKLWELSTGREIMTVFAMPGQDFLLGAGFSADGRMAFAASSDGVAEMVDTVPWNSREWPGNADDEPELRLELQRRRERTGLAIEAADVCLSLDEAEKRLAERASGE